MGEASARVFVRVEMRRTVTVWRATTDKIPALAPAVHAVASTALEGLLFVFFLLVSFPILDAGRQHAHTHRGRPHHHTWGSDEGLPPSFCKPTALLQPFPAPELCGVGSVSNGHSVATRTVHSLVVVPIVGY